MATAYEAVEDVLGGFFDMDAAVAPAEPDVAGGLAHQDSEGTAKKLRLRHHAIKELVSTEQRYGEKLQLLFNSYYVPLMAAAVAGHLSDADVRLIFSSFVAIMQCQQKFYSDLSEAKDRWDAQEEGGVFSFAVSGDGGIISVVERYTPFFKMYRPYVAGYGDALRKLDAVKADKSMTAVFDECRKLAAGTALDTLLIEPVQRIPRYRMLLEEARKHTPEEMTADVVALDNAIKEIGAVATHINESSRQDEDRRKVVEIHSRFKAPKVDDLQAIGAIAALVQPKRLFLKEIPVQATEVATSMGAGVDQDKDKPRRLLLFNDMLMLVKDKGGEGRLLSYKAHINFDDRVNFSQTGGATWRTIDGMAHHNDDYHGSRGVHCKWKVVW